MQQAIALFVLKLCTGFHIFNGLTNLSSDFLAQGLVSVASFLDQDAFNNKHWFFVNVLHHSILLTGSMSFSHTLL